MIKAHKIRLNPTPPQEAYFYRASGVARFAWNWALEEYKRCKAAGQEIDWNSQLEYKTREAGGILQKVGRFFASSKRCHVCGYIQDDLQLSDREWKCPNCRAEHDRDENGAINIEMEGVSLLAGSGYIGATPVEFAASGLKLFQFKLRTVKQELSTFFNEKGSSSK